MSLIETLMKNAGLSPEALMGQARELHETLLRLEAKLDKTEKFQPYHHANLKAIYEIVAKSDQDNLRMITSVLTAINSLEMAVTLLIKNQIGVDSPAPYKMFVPGFGIGEDDEHDNQPDGGDIPGKTGSEPAATC